MPYAVDKDYTDDSVRATYECIIFDKDMYGSRPKQLPGSTECMTVATQEHYPDMEVGFFISPHDGHPMYITEYDYIEMEDIEEAIYYWELYEKVRTNSYDIRYKNDLRLYHKNYSRYDHNRHPESKLLGTFTTNETVKKTRWKIVKKCMMEAGMIEQAERIERSNNWLNNNWLNN